MHQVYTYVRNNNVIIVVVKTCLVATKMIEFRPKVSATRDCCTER